MYDEEWRRLCAERAAARGRLRADVAAVKERVTNPFGIRDKVRRHPKLVAGIAIGAGLLAAKKLFGGKDHDEVHHEEHHHHEGNGTEAAQNGRAKKAAAKSGIASFAGTLGAYMLRPVVTRFAAQRVDQYFRGRRDPAEG